VTSTTGIFGAAAAAAKLLKLNETEIQNALGIAGSMSSGLKENFGTMTKSLHVGLAASQGIQAALLARLGIDSSRRILEGPFGFCSVMSREPEPERIIRDFGKPWEIEIPGVTRKQYPCCARTHTAIDGVLNIVRQNDIDHSQLDEIVCATDETAGKVLIHPSPSTELEAKFSMPFCLSIAFLEKDVFIQHFSREWLRNPGVTGVMNKVRHVIDADITRQGYENRWTSEVVIKRKNGDSFSESIQRPKGDPLNPLTIDELINKFIRCARGILNPQLCDSIAARLTSVEEQKDVAGMLHELASGTISK
jgi:2-methylcitrate dehydratase PrpD